MYKMSAVEYLKECLLVYNLITAIELIYVVTEIDLKVGFTKETMLYLSGVLIYYALGR